MKPRKGLSVSSLENYFEHEDVNLPVIRNLSGEGLLLKMSLFEKNLYLDPKKGTLWNIGGKVTYFNWVKVEIISRCHSDK